MTRREGAQPNLQEGGEFGYEQAERQRIVNDQRKVARTIAEQRDRTDRAQAKLRTEKAKLDKLVALSVSEHPSREDWYNHPGALPRQQARVAAGLTNVGLHRLMERYRKAHPSRRRARASK